MHLVPEILYIKFFMMADSRHFEYYAPGVLPVTFERCIGVHFPPKWFWLSNPSREKGMNKMVIDSKKMSLYKCILIIVRHYCHENLFFFTEIAAEIIQNR